MLANAYRRALSLCTGLLWKPNLGKPRDTVENIGMAWGTSAIMFADVLLQHSLGCFGLRKAILRLGIQGGKIDRREGSSSGLHPLHDANVARDGVTILL